MTERRGYPKVLARVENGPVIRCTGREGMTLLTLIERGSKGVSGVDFPGGPAFRLGAYVFDLRAMGIGIETQQEEHNVGFHGRYRLVTPVTVISVDHGQPVRAAS